MTANISSLVRDFFHNPPSYSAKIQLSWGPKVRVDLDYTLLFLTQYCVIWNVISSLSHPILRNLSLLLLGLICSVRGWVVRGQPLPNEATPPSGLILGLVIPRPRKPRSVLPCPTTHHPETSSVRSSLMAEISSLIVATDVGVVSGGGVVRGADEDGNALVAVL